MATQTSILSYLECKHENLIAPRQRMVYLAVSQNPRISDRELAQSLSLPINSITPRRNELERMGYIRNCGVKYDETTNRLVKTYWVYGD
jgi:DNA-binding MarR family transcriptional regulator